MPPTYRQSTPPVNDVRMPSLPRVAAIAPVVATAVIAVAVAVAVAGVFTDRRWRTGRLV